MVADAANRDVFGYVTTEVGMVIEVDAEATFERRFSQCLARLTSLSTELSHPSALVAAI